MRLYFTLYFTCVIEKLVLSLTKRGVIQLNNVYLNKKKSTNLSWRNIACIIINQYLTLSFKKFNFYAK